MENNSREEGGTIARLFAHFALILAIFTLALVDCGCASYVETSPPRNATEQLLISTAMDRALTNGNWTVFNNKKVFVDSTYFASYDQQYAMGDIRDALSTAGALLVNNVTNSDIVVEARSGALSIDASSTFFGIPAFGAPVPLSGGLSVPELPFYKSVKQDSLGKIALLAYDTKTGRHIYSTGSMVGTAYNYHRAIFFVSWWHSDIPEKQKSEKRREQESVEFSTPPSASQNP